MKVITRNIGNRFSGSLAAQSQGGQLIPQGSIGVNVSVMNGREQFVICAEHSTVEQLLLQVYGSGPSNVVAYVNGDLVAEDHHLSNGDKLAVVTRITGG